MSAPSATVDSAAANDAELIALQALGWTLGDENRAQRLLALTGLDPEQLRTGLAQPEIQRAVLDFLAAHEPDLIAAAEALDIDPAHIMQARDRLAA